MSNYDALQALLALYADMRRDLLFKIADLAEAGQSPYTPATALEMVFAFQLQRDGYVELIPLEEHPDFPDLVVRYAAKITEKGLAYAVENRG
ncbi:MAG: hypothetical protein K8L91_01530 [Anaerolineae bacterium]|nr:hypothetical protein [Anaerolineae bacterium]